MHADEYRDPELTRRQIIENELSDPVRLYTKYEGMLARNRRSDRQDLKRQINSAQNALGGLKEENEELRQKLKALRSSKTMKAGKLIATPARVADRARKNIKPAGRKALRGLKTQLGSLFSNQGSEDLQRGTSGPETPQRSGPAQVDATHAASDSPKPLAEVPEKQIQTGGTTPLDKFEEKKTQLNFERALNHLWYQRGEISASQDLINANPKWVEGASEKTAVLIRRVRGASRLFRGSVIIPARSRGAAYIPENDRVMYCVHSTPVFNSNGYSTRTRGVARGIVDAGGDSVVVARSGYPWDTKVDRAKPAEERYVEEVDGVTYVHNPGPNLNRDGLDDYINEVADTFVREAVLNRPSIIQSASNHRTALPALIAARRVGVPFVYEVRGLWEITEAVAKPGFEKTERFEAQKRLETLVCSEADHVLAITREVADELVARGIERDKISVVPNAVDPHEFVPLPRDKRYAESKGYDPELPTIGFAGSFVGYEGLDLLLEASAKLTHEGVHHQVVLAGSGREDEALREKADALGTKNIHFLGRLPQDEVVRVLSTFDIVACPRTSSRITELVSPLKPLEAFATSKATVVSDVAPNLTLAGDQVDNPRALAFPAGNVDELADVLGRLIANSDLRLNLGRTARLWVVRERNWQAIASQMRGFHRAAEQYYEKNVAGERSLADLKVGVIADKFTRTSLEATFDSIVIDRTNWRSQLEEVELDLLFVESAWEGNDGQWTRGVGFYGEAENADLAELVDSCRKLGTPTVFWNKEDPVHFERFAPTAAMFDHVFTTDANMINEYRRLGGTRNVTVSSRPFYAQPKLHNPLAGSKAFSATVAYAGSYYGDRYKERTQRLDKLLASAYEYGLDIYDRQADNPDSPYKFPGRYQRFVRGSLPYEETIETYKSHLAHLNVNSVEDSPTMYSRRVVEIPACGGVVVSAQGRGIAETLGNTIATANEPHIHKAWLHSWATDANGWFNERWRQMRTVFRSHTSDTAMTILARTTGLPVVADSLPSYALISEDVDVAAAREVTEYSHRPTAVIATSISAEATHILNQNHIIVLSEAGRLPDSVEWLGQLVQGRTRTFYEDLLTGTRYGEWSFIDGHVGTVSNHEEPLARVVQETSQTPALSAVFSKNEEESDAVGLVLRIPAEEATSLEDLGKPALQRDRKPQRVLIAGHDLKFATAFIETLLEKGFEVDIDEWSGHNSHDVENSREKLKQADVVFAEWGLGNAVWYSRHLQPHQRMFVRVHSQELSLPYLSKINHSAVDGFIFVGELIRRSAVESHGVPDDKSLVVPNFVDTAGLDLPKRPDASHTLGLVGITPQQKRLDLALDVLERLLEVDPAYRLRIKGKMPSDYPWMKNRPEEMAYYDRQLERAAELNKKYPNSVLFDGFGQDMADWYQKVGVVLSTSDFESFHFTIADGVASGARPVSLGWAGADLIYPDSWLMGTPDQMASEILTGNWSETDQEEAKQFIGSRFGQEHVLKQLVALVSSNGAHIH